MATPLSPEDKEFIKLYSDGGGMSKSFRLAYPNHPKVINWHATRNAPIEVRRKANEALKDTAKNKLVSKRIAGALTTYQDSMERFSILSLETATDLVQNARSEKVRADLAIEGIRHKVGTPVQKVAVQEQKIVTLTFKKPEN